MKARTIASFIVLMLFISLFAGGNTMLAAKTVYRVDRFGELNEYSGNSVVTIKPNVSAVDRNAFNGVRTTRFTAPGNTYFKTIGGILYSKDGTQLIKCPTEKKGTVMIPSTVTKIAHSAFENCTGLTRIVIPDSVKTIEEQAFYHCSALRQIGLSNHLTSLKDEVFSGCSSLRQIQLPDSIVSLGEKSFYNCQSLVKVTLPDSVTDVGDQSFANCISLRNARLSKKMTIVRERLFENCTQLRKVENTNGIEEIEWRACKNCVNLTTFSFSGKLDSIDGEAFYNCIKLGTVVILRGTEQISNTAFTGAASKFIVDSGNPNYSSRNGMLLSETGDLLIQAPANRSGHLEIPGSVVTIAEDALCNGRYQSVTIPEGVVNIDKTLFYNCERLQSIALPASLENIYGSYYSADDYNMKRLEQITVARGNKRYCSVDGVVYSSDGKRLIFYPYGRQGSFRLPKVCKEIGAQMQLNQLTSVSVPEESKYFSSSGGVLYDKKMRKIRCFPMRKKKCELPATLRDISYLNRIKADMKCRAIRVSPKNKRFSSKAGVVFDSNRSTLLFYPTKKRGAYRIPVSTTHIAVDAFDEAHNLSALTMTKNVKRSRGSTFYFQNCKKLKTIIVNQGALNYISMNFKGCSRLSKLTFPSTIMTTNLKNLPQGVTIHGWKNTYAKEAAEEANGTFVSRGTIPNVVSGIKIRKIIDKYQLSWNASSEASGYQVYTASDTIKNLSGSGSTSCFIADQYTEDIIYIRAYKIVNKKKVYGKARWVSIR